MKLGVFTGLFGTQSFPQALDYIRSVGVEGLEIGTGNYPGSAHCPLDELLRSESKRKAWKSLIDERGLTLEALSCHGNPLHPSSAIAKAHHETFRKTVRLAEMLGVKTVVAFSGCPGDSDRARYPNWVTCPWPDDYLSVLEWQWKMKVIPYWKREAKFAQDHGVRVALEPHPGFVVYNTETARRIHDECGENLGVNLDPSHLFWQGIDPCLAVRELSGLIFHVHAKDTYIDPVNTAVNGVLDTKHYREETKRSWIFRTIGFGHDEHFWRAFVSSLRLAGYDGVISIEHEDSLVSVKEGFEKAVQFLQRVILKDPAGKMWWA
jgi:sugar phosphate isomerase/epimerase